MMVSYDEQRNKYQNIPGVKDLAKEVLEATLERLDKDGWHQGKLVAEGNWITDQDNASPKCIAGLQIYALRDLNIANDFDPDYYHMVDAVSTAYLEDGCVAMGASRSRLFGNWNDQRDRTEEDIRDAILTAIKLISESQLKEQDSADESREAR